MLEKNNFLDHFDNGVTPREVQVDFADFCNENADDADVIVCVAPVGSGKSRMLSMVANYYQSLGMSSAGMVPTKILQDQFESDFTWVPLLKGANAYPCVAMVGKSCADCKIHTKQYCKPEEFGGVCEYRSARRETLNSLFALFNYHSFYRFVDGSGNLITKNVLLIDEAHNIHNFISGMYEKNIWKFQEEYPDFKGIEFNKSKKIEQTDVAEWIKDSLIPKKELEKFSLDNKILDDQAAKQLAALEQEIEQLREISSNLKHNPDKFMTLLKKDTYRGFEREYESYRNTEQEFLYIKPLDISNFAQNLFKRGNSKIFLFSGTINEIDIKKLGLNNKKVKYFYCNSPIPPENRPFVYWPIAPMSYKERSKSLPKIIDAILNIIEAPQNKNKKGVVHASYDIANALRNRGLSNDRLMFHTQRDKTDVYNRFLANKKNAVLIASGMDEGIDLNGEEFGFQIISMLMRPNISDDVNFHNLKYNRQYYNWETVRKILQQTGRICRGPDDKGTTWMIDSQFGRFYNETLDMWPKYFKEAYKHIGA